MIKAIKLENTIRVYLFNVIVVKKIINLEFPDLPVAQPPAPQAGRTGHAEPQRTEDGYRMLGGFAQKKLPSAYSHELDTIITYVGLS